MSRAEGRPARRAAWFGAALGAAIFAGAAPAGSGPPVDEKHDEAGPGGGTGSAGTGQPAATATVSVTVDPPQARIGDTIRVAAKVEGPPGTVVVGPAGAVPGERLGAFQVIDVRALENTLTLDLSPERIGQLEIPSFGIVYRAPGSGEGRATAPASKVSVASVLGEGNSSALADLKPPADLPVPWPWRGILLGAAGATVLAGAAIWIARRLKRRVMVPVAPEDALAPGVTPDIWARDAIARLMARGLLESGRIREFHIELADLSRRYLELRFRIPALERTTEEVREELEKALVGETVAALAGAVLEQCDRVKFAKHTPSGDEIGSSVGCLRTLVERSAVRPPEPHRDPLVAVGGGV